MDNKQTMNLKKYFYDLRKEFPILNKKINGNNIIYVDNAATTQKPNCVIDGISYFYKNFNSNIHRGINDLSIKSSQMYDDVRKKVKKFINSELNEVIFTSGATNSLNMIISGLYNYFNKGDEILILKSEHHANLVGWQVLSEKKGVKLKYIDINKNFEVDINDLKNKLSNKTKLVSIGHVSNVLGSINDVELISNIIRDKNKDILFVLDVSASIPHLRIDVKKFDVDFLVFSSHKIMGPSGVGVLYGKYDKLKLLAPLSYGGDMIDEVYFNFSTFLEPPFNLEAGTPNIEGVIGFGYAIDFLEEVGINNIIKYEKLLINYFLDKIKKLDNFILYGKNTSSNRAPIFSFNINGIHSHDVSSIFNENGIIIRSGHHCTMPLHVEKLKISSSNRISFSFYNTFEEIDKIIDVLSKMEIIFKKGDFLIK